MAGNATDDCSGALLGTRYLFHDRDTKFCPAFPEVLRSSGYRPLMLPPRSPNLNAFAERWVRSVKQECLSRLILFGETSLRRAPAISRNTTTPNAITKAKEFSFFSLPLVQNHQHTSTPSAVANA